LPAAWLGLSQLHTLRGVSLDVVPATAIAAALPRLHTLHLDHRDRGGKSPVAAFYDELLPRLRSFRLEGSWPEPSDETETTDVVPLPLLEDLKWHTWDVVQLPHRLQGARPSTLEVTDEHLLAWLKAVDGASANLPTPVTSPLACVRALTLRLRCRPPQMACMPWLLREAPQLRQLTFDVFGCKHALWVLSDAATPKPPFTGPAFVGLAHPRLRHLALTSMTYPLDVSVPRGCGARLRQRHFPRLRRLTVQDEDYPVWCAVRPARKNISF
jgi:hypothetical protein